MSANLGGKIAILGLRACGFTKAKIVILGKEGANFVILTLGPTIRNHLPKRGVTQPYHRQEKKHVIAKMECVTYNAN